MKKQFIWTKEKCKEEASKYSSRSEFKKGNQSAYLTAWKNGWLDEWFKKQLVWTYEKCKEEASKYSSRSELKKGSFGAYNAAWKNKWLNNFFNKPESN